MIQNCRTDHTWHASPHLRHFTPNNPKVIHLILFLFVFRGFQSKTGYTTQEFLGSNGTTSYIYCRQHGDVDHLGNSGHSERIEISASVVDVLMGRSRSASLSQAYASADDEQPWISHQAKRARCWFIRTSRGSGNTRRGPCHPSRLRKRSTACRSWIGASRLELGSARRAGLGRSRRAA